MDLEQLSKLHILKEQGVISQAEFEMKKQELLYAPQQQVPVQQGYITTNKSIFGYWAECVFTKFACFKGRARRKEYFGFAFVCFLIQLALAFISGFMLSLTGDEQFLKYSDLISIILSIIFLLPNLGVLVRRLHDVNMSGWWILTLVVPMVVIYFKSDLYANNYGPVPEGIRN